MLSTLQGFNNKCQLMVQGDRAINNEEGRKMKKTERKKEQPFTADT